MDEIFSVVFVSLEEFLSYVIELDTDVSYVFNIWYFDSSSIFDTELIISAIGDCPAIGIPWPIWILICQSEFK